MTTEAKPAWADLGYKELGEALDEKRKSLAEIFTKYEDVALIPEDEAKRIKPLNDELSDMGERFDHLRELDEAKQRSAEEPEKKVSRPAQPVSGHRPQQFKSLGEQFTESEAFEAYVDRKQLNVNVELDAKAFFGNWESKSTLGTDSALAGVDTQYAPESIRLPGIITPGEQPLMVADLFPQATTTQNSIVYMEETTTTNAAAETAEAATKPESALDFTESSTPVRKIATWIPVTSEAFQDVPQLRGYVNQRLRRFVLAREDSQLLVGDGIAPNLEGILNVTGIQTQAKGGDPTPDAFYKAMTLIRTGAFLSPDAVVMHPNDWQDVRLLRTADGIYIWGSPLESGQPRLWGLNVVQTTALTENTGLVGAFRDSAMIFRRETVNLKVSDQHASFAIENKLAIIAEERLALAVFRPAGFATVTGI